MSKSYGKYKTMGIATGSNTEYYRDRRRRERNKNKQKIRNVIAQGDPEKVEEINPTYKEPRNTRWNEPTDGTWKLFPWIKEKIFSKIYKVKGKNRIKK